MSIDKSNCTMGPQPQYRAGEIGERARTNILADQDRQRDVDPRILKALMEGQSCIPIHASIPDNGMRTKLGTLMNFTGLTEWQAEYPGQGKDGYDLALHGYANAYQINLIATYLGNGVAKLWLLE